LILLRHSLWVFYSHPFPPGLNSISQRLSARELRPAERRKEPVCQRRSLASWRPADFLLVDIFCIFWNFSQTFPWTHRRWSLGKRLRRTFSEDSSQLPENSSCWTSSLQESSAGSWDTPLVGLVGTRLRLKQIILCSFKTPFAPYFER